MPHLRLPMDLYSMPHVRLIVLKFATQTGKTETQLNCIGYTIHQKPGPTLAVYPNEQLYKKISTTRIQPMIDECPDLSAKKVPNPDRFKIEEMHFRDCILYLSSAQTPAGLASMPIENLFCDEVSKYPEFSGREGGPVDHATERQKTYPHSSKTVLVSSPTTHDGPISTFFKTCMEQLYRFVPCPHCGAFQIMKFSDRPDGKHRIYRVKFDKFEGFDATNPEHRFHAKQTAYYECEVCREKIIDDQKDRMLPAGRWLREDGSEPNIMSESFGLQLGSIYSPFVSLGMMISKFLEVKDDPPRLMNFINGWLGEEWEDISIERKEPIALLESNRMDIAPQTVSRDAICLTMGIDTQLAGFPWIVRAWLRDRTSCLVDYGFAAAFSDLETLIFERSYPIDGTAHRMGIWRAPIDTGGTQLEGEISQTEAVYEWLRKNGRGIAFGVKGATWKTGHRVAQTIIGKMPGKSGRVLPGGLVIYLVDTTAFKEAIHVRLAREANEGGRFLFHRETTQEYMEQLLAEYKRKDTRTGKTEWVQKKGVPNHFLDCEVYAMAAVDNEWLGGIELLEHQQRLVKERIQNAPKPAPPRPERERGEFQRPGWLDR